MWLRDHHQLVFMSHESTHRKLVVQLTCDLEDVAFVKGLDIFDPAIYLARLGLSVDTRLFYYDGKLTFKTLI